MVTYKKISCYDQRPLEDIRTELLHSPAEQIDPTAICIILCDRILDLEHRIIELESGK